MEKKVTNKASRTAEILSCVLGLLVTAIIVTALVILLPNSTSDFPLRDQDYDIKVMISVSEDSPFRVTTENPVSIRPGEDVVFGVEISEGYKLSIDEGMIYDAEAKTVTILGTKFPTNVRLNVVQKESFPFSAYCELSKGSMVTSVKPGFKYEEGTRITVSTTPKGDNMFVCYTLGDYLKNGGAPVAYSSTYEFEISETTILYANYATEGAKMLLYNANGGKVAGSDSEVICTEEVMEFYLCPNTLPEKGYFERDGYILYGYNTEPDGSGTYYGCGWNVIMEEGEDLLTLYAQWIKETPQTDFGFKSATDADGKKYAILNQYNGDDETVVIPLDLGGIEVRAIDAGTFANKNVKTVYLNRNIQTITDGAFKGCTELETIYIYDDVRKMTDAAFTGCTNLKTAYVLACVNPKYNYAGDSGSGAFSVKFERLITTKGPKIVLVSGSSSTWGLNTPRLLELIGDDYAFVNYGTNAYASSTFYLQIISHFVDKDDIVLLAPEPVPTQLGASNVSGGALWRIMESCYDAIQYVDISSVTGLWSDFATNNTKRSKMADCGYSTHSESVSSYGELIAYKAGTTNGKYSEKADVFNPDRITEENMARLNVPLDAIAAKGAKVWVTFSPYNIECLKPNSEKASVQKSYEDKLASLIHGELISTIAENLFAGELFSGGDDLHLATEGALKRSEVLAETLLRKFNSMK